MSKNGTALRYMQVYLDLKDQIAGCLLYTSDAADEL